MPRLIEIRRPEGGAEREVMFLVHHKCAQSKALGAVLNDENIDLLQFPVGLVGWEMPLDVPFSVTSTNPCDACGADIGAWFVWRGSRIISIGGDLWQPDGAA